MKRLFVLPVEIYAVDAVAVVASVLAPDAVDIPAELVAVWVHVGDDDDLGRVEDVGHITALAVLAREVMGQVLC